MIILKTPEAINAARLLSLKAMLYLEVKGMKRSRKGRSALSIVRAEFGFKEKTALAVYPKYVEKLREMKILV